MSRIHEALKKAEQERAALQGGQAPTFEPAAEPPMTAKPEESSVAGPEEMPARNIPAAAAMPSFTSPFSLDALLARCPTLQWKPDAKTMLFFNGDDSARVTSALPKEGKSFTAANLAQVMVRQHGRRVLLIDGDLRGPRLHLMLGTTASSGLADYLQGRGDEFSIMQRGAMEGLFFIPSGQDISDPAELVGNGRLKLLLQRVEALFDWIIIDSPPAVPVSDASVLAKSCDGVLMVVRSNATPVDMARRAREEFPDEALVGVVLNGTNSEALPYSRYYYETYVKDVTESKS
jgi:capsular exopolysaccharide synthesis family protein